jgi:hypothetical protein
MRKSFSTSLEDSADVGSSMTISRDFMDSARAISTICCSATFKSRTMDIGRIWRPSRAVIARVSAAILCQFTKTPGPGSRPIKTFSAIVMFGARVNSW